MSFARDLAHIVLISVVYAPVDSQKRCKGSVKGVRKDVCNEFHGRGWEKSKKSLGHDWTDSFDDGRRSFAERVFFGPCRPDQETNGKRICARQWQTTFVVHKYRTSYAMTGRLNSGNGHYVDATGTRVPRFDFPAIRRTHVTVEPEWTAKVFESRKRRRVTTGPFSSSAHWTDRYAPIRRSGRTNVS